MLLHETMKKFLVTLFIGSMTCAQGWAGDSKIPNLTLSKDEVGKLLKMGEASSFNDCYKYYEFEFFGQQLIQANYQDEDETMAKKEFMQLKNYLETLQLQVRHEVVVENPRGVNIPQSVQQECDELARVATEAAAIRTSILVNALKSSGPKSPSQ
jgi:hypothetical protein